MIEIKLSQDVDKQRSEFLLIRETLTRIGIANNADKKLFQSCHILQKRGLFYIAHFKDLLKLDGKTATLSEEDQKRKQMIARLLQEWGMCEIVDQTIPTHKDQKLIFTIVPYNKKKEWTLVQKYHIGKVKKAKQ